MQTVQWVDWAVTAGPLAVMLVLVQVWQHHWHRREVTEPNGGKSLRDRIDRIEESGAKIHERINVIDQRISRMEGRLDGGQRYEVRD